jgi:transmembrane sensor
MARDEDEIDAAALDWAIRTGEPDFADWEAFTAWLEADPRHAARYQALQADADDLADLVPATAPLPMQRPQRVASARSAPRRWLAGAVAAALTGVVGVSVLQTRSDPYVVETGPGVTRTVALGDGSSIALNGGTRLTLDHRDKRYAVVDRGEALFTVRHDAARPFKVKVGGDELIDVGTVFDVIRSDGKTWVAVAEGALIFNPRKEAVPLPAGRALSTADGVGDVQVSDIATAAVGSWQRGQLDFAGAPLEEVAAALSRAMGVRLTVAPPIAARTFRGTIALADLRQDPARLERLLDVSMRRTPGGWEIAPPP